MRSLYKVIKNTSINPNEGKEIVTEFTNKENAQKREWSETNAKNFIDSYEDLAKTMIENARRQSELLVSNACAEAEKIEDDAYKKGYSKGLEEGNATGYKEGYEESYTKNIDRALKEAEEIKINADNIIKSSIEQSKDYFKIKEEEIKSLIIDSVENILKREVQDKDSMNKMIFEALYNFKKTNSFIIKAKKAYCEEIKNNIELWKEQLPFQGDIFVIVDELLEEGTVIIERENGKTILSIENAMEKLKEIMYTSL